VAPSRSFADAIAFLASEDAAYVNGVVLPVDGGGLTATSTRTIIVSSPSRVKGVKAVVEEIKVQLFGDNLWADDKIAEHAVRNLASDVCVPKDHIKLAVEKGWVTLTGEVDWNFQKSAAENDIHRLIGVLGVTSKIEVKPPVQAYEVREKIEKALGRVAPFDAENISIKTDGGKVALSGNVRNWYERDLVETAAWSVPGVTQVQDKIALTW